jgi:hypothetical protein
MNYATVLPDDGEQVRKKIVGGKLAPEFVKEKAQPFALLFIVRLAIRPDT